MNGLNLIIFIEDGSRRMWDHLSLECYLYSTLRAVRGDDGGDDGRSLT